MKRLFGVLAVAAISCAKQAPVKAPDPVKPERKVFGECIVEKDSVSFFSHGTVDSVPLFQDERIFDADCRDRVIIITNKNLLAYSEKDDCGYDICLGYRIYATDITEIHRLGIIDWVHGEDHAYFITEEKVLAVVDILGEKTFAYAAPEIEKNSKLAYFDGFVFISNDNEVVANKPTEDDCESYTFEIKEKLFHPGFRNVGGTLYYGDGFSGYSFEIKEERIEISQRFIDG